MKKIQDDRVRFYLRNQALIDQWAQLAKQVPEHLHAFMGTLESDLEKVAQAPEVELYSHLDGPHQLFLHRPAWHRTEDDAPRVAIGLEWGKGATFAGSSVPYVGLWVNDDLEGSQELRERLRARLKACDHQAYTVGSNSAWWIAYRWVRPPNEIGYWDDLEPYRGVLLEAAKNAWELFAPEVDAALRS